MEDIQILVDTIFPLIKKLITQYQEFYPIAIVINNYGETLQIGYYDGNDHPTSKDLMEDLVVEMRSNQLNYRTIAIFYDVKLTEHETGNRIDAIAVHTENKNNSNAFTFYYPYELVDEYSIIIKSAWKELSKRKVFD